MKDSKKIVLGRLFRKPLRIEPPPTQDWQRGVRNLYFTIFGEAQESIIDHSQSNRDIEIGGILLGEVYEYQEIYWVSITDVLPARNTTSSGVHITFTVQTWLDIIDRRSKYPDKMTVGWYHSHPGFGVFLSKNDLFIQRSLFGDEPWYIAIVIDPHSGEQGVFAWDGGQIVRCSNDTIHPIEKTEQS